MLVSKHYKDATHANITKIVKSIISSTRFVLPYEEVFRRIDTRIQLGELRVLHIQVGLPLPRKHSYAVFAQNCLPCKLTIRINPLRNLQCNKKFTIIRIQSTGVLTTCTLIDSNFPHLPTTERYSEAHQLLCHSDQLIECNLILTSKSQSMSHC